MTDEPTLPQGGDTAPILERILEELRAMREDNAKLRAELRGGFADLRRELSETRTAFRGEISLESTSANARLADHERRLAALEDAGRPQ
jgi:hypothetical protein